MINIIKNNKIKLLIFGIVMFLCMIICMNYTKAYTIDSNGNLISDNLFNINNVLQNNVNGTTITDPTTAWNYDIYSNTVGGETPVPQNFDINKLPYLESGTYYLQANVPNEHYLRIDKVNEDKTITTLNWYQNSSYTLDTNTRITIRMETADNNSWSVSNIMISKGSNEKTYEPYGTWYSQENYNEVIEEYNNLQNIVGTTSYIFNNAYCVLKNRNTNQELISETIHNIENVTQISIRNQLPNIYNYLRSYDQICNLEINLNQLSNPILQINFVDTINDYEIVLTNKETNQSISYTRNVTDYYMFINENRNFMFNKISINDLYPPDYFEVDLSVSADNSLYNQGYVKGQQDLETTIYNLKNDINRLQQQLEFEKTNGYNNGYNEGLEQSNSLYGMIIRSCRYTSKYI